MMKKLAVCMAVASAALLPLSAQAATVNGPFTVSVLFTPSCTVTSTGSTIAFTYTAFAAAVGPTTISAPIAVQCSRGFGATIAAAYDNAGAAEGLIGTATSTNLRYTLSAITKGAVVAGTAATAAAIGTADTTSWTFSGSLPSQAGNAAPNTPLVAVTATRNLVLTF